MNLFEDQAKQDIAAARGTVALKYVGSDEVKFSIPRPTDNDFIADISGYYGITYTEAADWILEIADRMRVSP